MRLAKPTLEAERAKMMNMRTAADAAANASEMDAEMADGLVRIGEMAKRHGVTLRTLRFMQTRACSRQGARAAHVFTRAATMRD